MPLSNAALSALSTLLTTSFLCTGLYPLWSDWMEAVRHTREMHLMEEAQTRAGLQHR